MKERFIGENIQPATSTADISRMASGEPGLPQRFVWRNRDIEVEQLIRSWKETSPCKHGGKEQYLRKHWYEFRSGDTTYKIYFERQARSKSQRTRRWWLYSTAE